jgi:hypothetical protein
MERALHDFRNARGVLDLRRPFRRRAEKRAIVHFLKRAAPEHGALDLADEQDHRRRIMLGDMHAMRGVGRARSARHKAHAGATGQPGARDRHHRRARLLPADGDVKRGIMQRVEHGEIRFAGHAKHMLDALDAKLIDEYLPAGAGVGSLHHIWLVTVGEN